MSDLNITKIKNSLKIDGCFSQSKVHGVSRYRQKRIKILPESQWKLYRLATYLQKIIQSLPQPAQTYQVAGINRNHQLKLANPKQIIWFTVIQLDPVITQIIKKPYSFINLWKRHVEITRFLELSNYDCVFINQLFDDRRQNQLPYGWAESFECTVWEYNSLVQLIESLEWADIFAIQKILCRKSEGREILQKVADGDTF